MGKGTDAAKAAAIGVGLAAQIASGQPTPSLPDQGATMQAQQAEQRQQEASQQPVGQEADKAAQEQHPEK